MQKVRDKDLSQKEIQKKRHTESYSKRYRTGDSGKDTEMKIQKERNEGIQKRRDTERDTEMKRYGNEEIQKERHKQRDTETKRYRNEETERDTERQNSRDT